jgi:hypothetical protein
VSSQPRNDEPSEGTDQPKVERVLGVVADYASDPGETRPSVGRVEDLFDDSTGLPR